MASYEWVLLLSAFCSMISALISILAVHDLVAYIRVLRSMVIDARKLGLRIPREDEAEIC